MADLQPNNTPWITVRATGQASPLTSPSRPSTSPTSTGETGRALAEAGGLLTQAVRYTIVLVQLIAAGIKLRWLSAQVRQTYTYIEGCAEAVDQQASTMASLQVDSYTVQEHHQAAAIMRSVLDAADGMASTTEDLAGAFHETAERHRGEYGTVNEAVRLMPVPMADPSFYSNR